MRVLRHVRGIGSTDRPYLGEARWPVAGQAVAFDQALVGFAERYADLNDGDSARLDEAAGTARIPVHSGV
jgi:hypothetical protein